MNRVGACHEGRGLFFPLVLSSIYVVRLTRTRTSTVSCRRYNKCSRQTRSSTLHVPYILFHPSRTDTGAVDQPHVWFSVICSLLTAHCEILHRTREALGDLPPEYKARLALDNVTVPVVANPLQRTKRQQVVQKLQEINNLLGRG